MRDQTMLRIFRREAPIGVLGPGMRAGVWVQGCAFGCKNCLVPESWDENGGEVVAVSELADWILAQPDIEGITLSGGEPMAQAGALLDLVDSVHLKADLGVVCYTGFVWEHLRDRGTPEQQGLLARIDLLIDGVYIESQHADLLWRGSSNQRLLPLTDRYRAEIEARRGDLDRSAGLEFYLNEEGALAFVGVPPRPGFNAELRAQLTNRGIVLADPPNLSAS